MVPAESLSNQKERQANRQLDSPFFAKKLIHHMRGRLQMLVHRGVTLPLIDQPIAYTKFKAQLLHIPIIGIEMLMMHHARRDVNGVALIPVVALAADLRIA